MHNQYNKNIPILLLIKFFMSLFLIKVIYTLYLQSKGLDILQIGLFLTSYQVTKVILEIPTGIIADKYGRKTSSLIGLVLFDIFIVILYQGSNVYILMLAGIIQGLAFTLVSGSFSALLVDSLIASGQKDKLAIISSLNQVIFYIALACSALVGGFIAKQYSYNTVYFLQVIIFIIPIILLVFVKEPIMEEEHIVKEKSISWKNIISFTLNEPMLIFLMIINCSIAISFISIDIYYANYLVLRSIDERYAGIILFILQILSALFVFLVIKEINETMHLKLLTIIPIIMIVALIISFSMKTLIVHFIFYFLGQFSFILICSILFSSAHKIIPSKYRASIDSLFSLTLAVSAILSNFTFGFLTKFYDFSKSFLLLLIISFFFLIINILKHKNVFKESLL